MKYMLSWFERPQGSPLEDENAQKRILEVFTQWKTPANFKIEFFVIRVGEWGGHMLMECDDPLTIHKFCSMLPAFVFQVHPVVPIEDAVRGELEPLPARRTCQNGQAEPGARRFLPATTAAITRSASKKEPSGAPGSPSTQALPVDPREYPIPGSLPASTTTAPTIAPRPERAP